MSTARFYVNLKIMTKLEDFLNYAKTLSPEGLEALEKKLTQLMPKPPQGDVGLSSEQLANIEKRRVKTPRKYASDEEVEVLLGRRFNS